MKRICKRLLYKSLVCKCLAIAAVVVFGGRVLTVPASAAPPTVTPSPGYDARLQEQHAARVRDEPVAPAVKLPSARVKRVHRDAH
jgi:hypothetical protein